MKYGKGFQTQLHKLSEAHVDPLQLASILKIVHRHPEWAESKDEIGLLQGQEKPHCAAASACEASSCSLKSAAAVVSSCLHHSAARCSTAAICASTACCLSACNLRPASFTHCVSTQAPLYAGPSQPGPVAWCGHAAFFLPLWPPCTP